MIVSNSNKPFVAISYDTVTFKDLQYWFNTLHNIQLDRIEPNEGNLTLSSSNQYINLVIKDLQLRKKITKLLDTEKHERFSFIHPSASVSIDVPSTGIFIYPAVIIYPNVIIEQDVIIHANTGIGHCCRIGSGTYISGSVSIGGSCQIGSNCTIGLASVILDCVEIVADVIVGAGALVKKNILVAGTYASPLLIKKLK